MRLETSRLLIRDWHPETDAADAIAIYGDPQVTQWIGDKSLDTTVEAVQARLQRYRDRAAAFPGLGCWAVVQPAEQTVIGTVLLMPLPGRDNQPSGKVEIGWHFRPASWGHGYATEAAQAVLQVGFATLGLPTIYAVTLPENERSIRVMQRLHLTDLGSSQDYYGGYTLRLFCRTREDSSKPS
ncbi:GNAT family N-acetyltransferase [Halomicronema sp. CCY15110]|uniref:GNAT family N-acetyltransferase n=1 Tax=Halomicronema sp. CCY15110 TaxID=2767773 RepID=UPI00194F8848|nr:GNAT family N-acetyltransferase [Halomicronema sp. CCY15110]